MSEQDWMLQEVCARQDWADNRGFTLSESTAAKVVGWLSTTGRALWRIVAADKKWRHSTCGVRWIVFGGWMSIDGMEFLCAEHRHIWSGAGNIGNKDFIWRDYISGRLFGLEQCILGWTSWSVYSDHNPIPTTTISWTSTTNCHFPHLPQRRTCEMYQQILRHQHDPHYTRCDWSGYHPTRDSLLQSWTCTET